MILHAHVLTHRVGAVRGWPMEQVVWWDEDGQPWSPAAAARNRGHEAVAQLLHEFVPTIYTSGCAHHCLLSHANEQNLEL